MARPIRAFLMLRSDSKEWTVHVCRDLEAVLSLWSEKIDQSPLTGVLHLGFDRPVSEKFARLADQYPGAMLITASAKYGLPLDFTTSLRPVGFVEEIPTFLGMRGWSLGQLEPASDVEEVSGEDDVPRPCGPKPEWLSGFDAANQEQAELLEQLGVYDDCTYFELEATLPIDIRRSCAIYRYEHHMMEATSTAKHDSDPIQIAATMVLQAVAFAPPWVRAREIDSIDLPPRVLNALRKNGVFRVHDLQGFTAEQLGMIRNLGPISIREIEKGMRRALDADIFDMSLVFGPEDNPDMPRPIDDKLSDDERSLAYDLASEMEQFLNLLSSRQRDVFVRRMGIGQQVQTLEAIAVGHGITRERVRQIEARVRGMLSLQSLWIREFLAKTAATLADTAYPLPVLGVEAADPWLKGFGIYGKPLLKALQSELLTHIQVLSIGSIEYLAEVSQEELDAVVRSAQEQLQGGVDKGWSEEHCRSMVSSLLSTSANEFSQYVWDEASRQCHFAMKRDGTIQLAAYGASAEALVKAVLAESSTPLHYTEIARLATRRRGSIVDVRRVHNAAASTGILLGRGQYGLRDHISLSDEDLSELASLAEEVILETDIYRQWHTSEILDVLIDSYVFPSSGLDQYVLDFAIKGWSTLESLKRMVWAVSEPNEAGAGNRIEMNQAIISILEQSDGSLSATEIKRRLVSVRGVSHYFQMFPGDPIIRTGPNSWGLNDRDALFSREIQPRIMNYVVDALSHRGTGLHISELADLVFAFSTSPSLPYIVYSLAADDPRLSTTRGQYIYLSEWEGPRRQTISSAVKEILADSDSPLALDEIIDKARSRCGRSVEPLQISTLLQNVSATFDLQSRKWTRGSDLDSYVE